jgi:hypothetical protein
MSKTSPEASKASIFAEEPKVSRRALPFVPQGKGSAGPEYFATPATGSARVCSLQLSLLAMPARTRVDALFGLADGIHLSC